MLRYIEMHTYSIASWLAENRAFVGSQPRPPAALAIGLAPTLLLNRVASSESADTLSPGVKLGGQNYNSHFHVRCTPE